LVESITLIKKYKEAKVIFTGCSGSINKPKMDHARIAKQFFMQMGLDTDKIIFENKSRNTYENVLYSKNIAKPKKNEKWIVITSAFHMNRAIFIGEKNDWTLIPYAVDFTHPKKFKFIDESYNANPLSMASAIKNINYYKRKNNSQKLDFLCGKREKMCCL